MGNQVVPNQPVKAKVRKPHESWEDINVLDNKDGTHKVTVFGQVDGKCKVTMTVGDQPIPGCPVIIPVVNRSITTIGSEGIGEGQYNAPLSVAINKNGEIVAADTDNERLQMTTRDGTFEKILNFPQFEMPFSPYDIAVCNDNEYYSLDNNNKQVVVSDEDGNVIRNFGQTELTDPYGIAISPLDDNVYVTEHCDDCVRIYTKHGKYLRSFGSAGNSEVAFNGPWGVVVGSNGVAFVADRYNNCIHVFNKDDKYLYSFECKSKAGELLLPMGITIENDKYIYVTATTDDDSEDGLILKFRRGGKFVCRNDSDSDRLGHPSGIALTDDVPSRVVVADRGNHCIKVFVQ
ncbi:tripartite motif-containing protein 2-like [Ptychodera flava]|uniref:tripartite motif-containing protein 2-like n=1 Tax=Ptychodera flava TaxID=63121 RepID=UPI00396A65FD